MTEPSAIEVRRLTPEGDPGDLLAVVRQDASGAITVEGDSPLAEDLRERAGTQFNETPSLMTTGMSMYHLKDV